MRAVKTPPEIVTPTNNCDDHVQHSLGEPIKAASIGEESKDASMTANTSTSVPNNNAEQEKRPKASGKRRGFLAALRDRLYRKRGSKSQIMEDNVPSQELSSCKLLSGHFLFDIFIMH